MSKTKHTPGPWKVTEFPGKGPYFIVESERGLHVTDFVKPADASLISASPDLLASCVEQAALIEGLRNLLMFYRCGKRPTEKVLDSVQDPSGIQERAAAAIAKALTYLAHR